MRRFALLLGLAAVLAGPARPAVSEQDKAYALRRNDAFALTDRGSPAAEAPLRALLKERKNDGEVWFALGRCQMDQAHALPLGNKARRKLLREAREDFVRAKENGSTQPMIATVLTEINPDGSENPRQMSRDSTVEPVLQEAERAFERKDFPAAIAGYERALALEPKNYLATLDLGDAYFASGKNQDAVVWFEKASALEPNRETAYRYCGDALLRLGRKDDALEKYIQAVIADPYNGYTRKALQTGCGAFLLKPWVQAGRMPMVRVIPGTDGEKTQIFLPENCNIFEVAYAGLRAKWQDENSATWKKTHQPYRQAIAEETAVLGQMLTMFAEMKNAKTPPDKDLKATLDDWGPTMDQLQELATAGLLEAHVFFFRANQDLAADYVHYRDGNREKLREYLRKFYLHLP